MHGDVQIPDKLSSMSPMNSVNRIRKVIMNVAASTVVVASFAVLPASIARADGNENENGGGSSGISSKTVPSAPQNVQATVGNNSITVTWAASASNGGKTITSYKATATPGDNKYCTYLTSSGGALTCTINNLSNSNTYQVCVVATNSKGSSTGNCVSGLVPLSAPAAPTAVTASYSAGLITISWTAPAGTISSYTLVDTNGNQICVTAATSCTWDAFSFGTSYRFKVLATNAVGNSSYSSASAAVIPLSVPGVPTNVSATAGIGKATISWQAPAITGGARITGYTVTATPGGATCAGRSGDDGRGNSNISCSISGLTNGTSYSFTVHATNSVGNGNESNAVSGIVPADAPSAPTDVTATFDGDNVRIQWTESDNNGARTDEFRVYLKDSDGGDGEGDGHEGDGHEGDGHHGYKLACTAPAGQNYCLYRGYTRGHRYTFLVTAHNSVGEGKESQVTPQVKTVSAPAAPASPTATAGNTTASLTWSVPANDGGSTITGYVVTSTPATRTCTTNASTRSCSYTNLTNGTQYKFTVVARNANGSSIPADSNTVIPMTVTSAPLNPRLTSIGNGAAVASWNAPSSLGGGAVLYYTITLQPGGATFTAPTTTFQLTGLTFGTTYSYSVTATNAAGESAASATSASLLLKAAPAAPSILASTGFTYAKNYYGQTDTTLTVNIAAPIDWGSSSGTNLGTMHLIVSGPSGTVYEGDIAVTSDGAGNIFYTNSLSFTGLASWSTYSISLYATNVDGNSATVSAVRKSSGLLYEPFTTTVYSPSQRTLTWNVLPRKSSSDAIYTLVTNGTTLCTGSESQVSKCVQTGVNSVAQADSKTPSFTEPFTVTVTVPGLATQTWTYTENLYIQPCPGNNSSCNVYIGNHYNYSFTNQKNMDLSNFDLQGSAFWKTDLSGTTLDNSNLSGSTIQYTSLNDSKSWGTNYSGVFFNNVTLSRARFVNASVSTAFSQGFAGTPYWLCGSASGSQTWADFPANNAHPSESASCRIYNGVLVERTARVVNADLTGLNASGMDLTLAAFDNVNLTNVNFSNTNLTYVRFAGSTLTGANLSGAIMGQNVSRDLIGTPAAMPTSYEVRGGYIAGPGVIITMRNLSGVDFSGLNLTGAVFSNDDMRTTNLSNTILSGAMFGAQAATNATLAMRPALLTGTNFSGASLNGVLRLNESFGSQTKGSLLYITGTPATLPYYLSFNAAQGALVIK